MNQGNHGSHEADNGAFHDGGLILHSAGRHVEIFLAFQTQRAPTDATGFPTADARPLSAIVGHPETTTGVTEPAIHVASL